jgi:hypothetical protein
MLGRTAALSASHAIRSSFAASCYSTDQDKLPTRRGPTARRASSLTSAPGASTRDSPLGRLSRTAHSAQIRRTRPTPGARCSSED